MLVSMIYMLQIVSKYTFCQLLTFFNSKLFFKKYLYLFRNYSLIIFSITRIIIIIFIIKTNQKEQKPKHFKMETNINQKCVNHKKTKNILVLNTSQYICQDCAIFNNKYKHQDLIESQSIQKLTIQIDNKCQDLLKKQKQNKILSHNRMKCLLEQVEQIETKLHQQIKKSFLSIKTKVSNSFLIQVDNINVQTKTLFQKIISQVHQQIIIEQKLKKQLYLRKDFQKCQIMIENHKQQINQVFIQFLDSLSKEMFDKTSLQIKQKSQKFINKMSKKDKRIAVKFNIDENLLDFSQYSILKQNQILKTLIQSQTTQQSSKCMNFTKNQTWIQRQTTANLDSSMSEFDQTQSKNMQNSQNIQNLQINEFLSSQMSLNLNRQQKPINGVSLNINSASISLNQSILSQRSISESIISQSTQNSHRQKVSKRCLQIKNRSQLTKLNSIPISIKQLKLNNLQLTNQQVSRILKTQINNHFVQLIDLSGNQKLTHLVFAQIHKHKNRSLKKVFIKNCFHNDNDQVKKNIQKYSNTTFDIIY